MVAAFLLDIPERCRSFTKPTCTDHRHGVLDEDGVVDAEPSVRRTAGHQRWVVFSSSRLLVGFR
jgi:hypothetical protein